MSTVVQPPPSVIVPTRADHAHGLPGLSGAPVPSRLSRIVAIVLTSAFILVPCFWHSRIQAGDLSSHIYNAWLAVLIEAGEVEGLTIATQWTNVLFDWALFYLFKLAGADFAQKIAVSVTVLVFFWGAFAFISAVSGRRPWFVIPCLAVLSYGWVFHMGFFNYYLSAGLCFWALALVWKPRVRKVLIAVPLFALACLAHALPAAWAVGLALFARVLRSLKPRDRIILTFSLLGIAFLLRPVIAARVAVLFPDSLTAERLLQFASFDQAWVFGPKYLVISSGLLVVCLIWLRRALQARGARRLLTGVPFQAWLAHSLAAMLLPIGILLPGYNTSFEYITERITLLTVVLTLACLAQVNPRRILVVASTAVAAVFFGFIYFDTGRINAVEDQAGALVAALPPKQRVIGPLCMPRSRINGFLHVVDRVCVGRCFSYANYEPASFHFRVKAIGQNPIVLSRSIDIYDITHGRYILEPADLPLYLLASSPHGSDLHMKSLPPGTVNTSVCALEAQPAAGRHPDGEAERTLRR